MPQPKVSLIGAGPAGQAMVYALHRLGYPIAAVASRQLKSAKVCANRVAAGLATTDVAKAAASGGIVLIATPDSAIETVAGKIASEGGFRPGQLVMHLSGALSSKSLHAAATAGAETLAFHPVQTLASAEEGARLLQQAYFCLEGSEQALVQGAALARALSGVSG